jgi:hypothetical protein
VAGKGDELDTEIFKAEGKLADCLHGIDVQGNLPAIGNAGDLFNRERTRFVMPNKVTSAVSGRMARSSFSSSSLPRLSTGNHVIS